MRVQARAREWLRHRSSRLVDGGKSGHRRALVPAISASASTRPLAVQARPQATGQPVLLSRVPPAGEQFAPVASCRGFGQTMPGQLLRQIGAFAAVPFSSIAARFYAADNSSSSIADLVRIRPILSLRSIGWRPCNRQTGEFDVRPPRPRSTFAVVRCEPCQFWPPRRSVIAG